MAKKDEDEDLVENQEIDDVEDPDSESDDEDGSGKPSKKEEESVEVEVEEDDKDEKIAVKKNKEYSEESLEEKRERRRAEKKRKRHQDYMNRQLLHREKEENAQLKKRIEALEQLTPKFQQRVDAQEEAQLDTAINSQANLYRQAEAQLEKAITEGNGTLAKEAQRVLLDANTKYTQLVALKQQYKDRNTKEAEVEKPAAKEGYGQAHIMYAKRWALENTWFHPDGGDEDSETAQIIDRELVAEGYDPNRREFWDEFKTRLKDELPHVFEEKRPRQNGNARPKPKQINGSVGADSASTGAKSIKIPESMMAIARTQGWLDDPKMKKRFIQNVMEQQKNTKVN